MNPHLVDFLAAICIGIVSAILVHDRLASVTLTVALMLLWLLAFRT